MDGDQHFTAHIVYLVENKPPSQLPTVGGSFEEMVWSWRVNRLLESPSTHRRKSEAHHPLSACGSESRPLQDCTTSGLFPPARNQPQVATDVSGAFSTPPTAQFSSLIISKHSSWSFNTFIRRQQGTTAGPGSPYSVSVSWGWCSVIMSCCFQGGGLLLESSPVSVVTLETDFCSRLVGWADKTALSDRTQTECLQHFPVVSSPPSLQSFQKTPSSCVFSLYSHPSMKSQEFRLAFGITVCREVSAKRPWPPRFSSFFIYLPLPSTDPLFPSNLSVWTFISWFKAYILFCSPVSLPSP